ncbi:MAG TPA: UDP-N-acetylmuramoyl-L-alanine--D-glutamate ligase, partial [Patescibacteria group bacterium]|nr:UDP-N-acetylmuramoyl-L-alanine--D-glutamate ligase [Patescibacteria group bacterium]
LMELSKKDKYAVVGFGLTGQRVAEFLASKRLNITIVDDKSLAKFDPRKVARLKAKGVTFKCGPGSLAKATGFDCYFRSPGIPLVHPLFIAARKQGSKISSQMRLFFEFCPAKIIGITGTKGKTTTANLLLKLLKSQGINAYLTGNLAADDPLKLLTSLKKTDVVICELSSFQLEDMTVSPTVAVVLMLSSDHIDYHKTRRSYLRAKRNIVRYQTKRDTVVYLPSSANFARVSAGRRMPVKVENSRAVVSFGKQKFLVDLSKFKPLGTHNKLNAAAAVTACISVGGRNVKAMERTLRLFKPVRHRLETVAVRAGVRFVNDSISTIPDTARAALSVFSEPLIIILGGQGKGLPYTGLAKAIAKHKNILGVIVYGQEGKTIVKALDAARVQNFYTVHTLPQVFGLLKRLAKPGITVLLSPAATSYDQYPNYEKRGEHFTQLAKNYKV